MNRTTTTPDGQTHTINTPHAYEYAVATRIAGTWGVFSWNLDIEAAELIEADLAARGTETALLAVNTDDEEI